VQETTPIEGPVVDINVTNSNSIAWRNLKIVTTAQRMRSSRFIVRNIRERDDPLTLEVAAAPELARGGRVLLSLDPALQRAMGDRSELIGAKPLGNGEVVLIEARARFDGLRMPPHAQGVAELRYEAPQDDRATGDIVVTQRSREVVDGGVTLRIAQAR